MTIEKYEKLTGTTVPTAKQDFFKAQIRRTRMLLESMLGYSLSDPRINNYEEKGKSETDFDLPDISDTLLEPDEVEFAYRLFTYNDKDKFLSIDPCETVHAVKLVILRGGEEPNGITVKTFDSDEFSLHVSKGNIKKFLEKTNECWWTWWAACDCEWREQVMLAVDADWLFFDCLPEEIKYLWSDMVTYYVNPNRNLKSETLGSHSYSVNTQPHPEDLPESQAILKKYAGPNGSLARTVTV